MVTAITNQRMGLRFLNALAVLRIILLGKCSDVCCLTHDGGLGRYPVHTTSLFWWAVQRDKKIDGPKGLYLTLRHVWRNVLLSLSVCSVSGRSTPRALRSVLKLYTNVLVSVRQLLILIYLLHSNVAYCSHMLFRKATWNKHSVNAFRTPQSVAYPNTSKITSWIT